VQLGTGSNFLLFDVSPADAGRAISIYRLPFVRNEVTIPDTPFGRATVRQPNLPGVMRLAQSQIRLLQKPVPSQPQMIELVPDPPLAQGLYGVLFAPATGVAVGGAGAGQSAAWTTLLLIGQSPEAERSGQCIDLTLTGGLGGMLGIDSPDVGRIAIFPLLNPGRAPACSSAPVSSASPGAAPSAPATRGSTRNLADFENDIEVGREVSFPIKYDSTGPSGRRTTALYTPGGGLAVNMADGVLTLSKTTFAFSGHCVINRGFGRVEHCDFRVSPGKILELANQPEQSSRLHVKVAIKNQKGDKEDKKDYYFYNAGATAVGDGSVGGPGTSIICSGCDDSMNVLYALLTKIR
jgi:hypothetical protein